MKLHTEVMRKLIAYTSKNNQGTPYGACITNAHLARY